MPRRQPARRRAGAPATVRGRRAPAEPRRAPDWVLRGSVIAVLIVLWAVGDDRHVGLIADGRQMIRTAVAIVETGGIGQAIGRDFTLERSSGDAISRFGMATSLLQVPAALVASPVESRFGPGSSQALFLLVPWLAVGLAAGVAGRIARVLGGNALQTVAAVLLASVAGPLGSYAFLEFSEPVQAAALALGLLAALRAATASTALWRVEVAAGVAAGIAVLAKSSLIVAAPFVLLPLLDATDPRRTRTAVMRAGLGAGVPITIWMAFEFLRFGAPFGGYPDDRFTHAWFDGAWRLLVGPNRGLLLFWPALILFGLFTRSGHMRQLLASPVSRGWMGAALAFAAQLAVAAGYWGWHGMEGWGPRLILAGIPLMAPFAAVAPVPRAVMLLTIGLCLSINLPPLLQHPTPVATYVMNLRWPEVGERKAADYPFYATGGSPGGRSTVVPFEVLETLPAANPWRLYLWIWRASHLGGQALADRLMQPPWYATAPALTPPVPLTIENARQIVPPSRIGFLGRSLTRDRGPYATVYLDALLDQVVLANQQGRIARAVDLSTRRIQLRVDGEAAAWHLETLRRADRAVEAETMLRSLPEAVRGNPQINVVLALFDRDFGGEPRARALLRSVADAFPEAPLQRALTSPLVEWPATLDLMTRTSRRDAAVAGSRAP